MRKGILSGFLCALVLISSFGVVFQVSAVKALSSRPNDPLSELYGLLDSSNGETPWNSRPDDLSSSGNTTIQEAVISLSDGESTSQTTADISEGSSLVSESSEELSGDYTLPSKPSDSVSALVGGESLTASSTSAFSENFENWYWYLYWYRGDDNPNSGSDYWDRTTDNWHGGSYSCWVAESGSHSYYGVPNTQVNQYDNNMATYLSRSSYDASGWDFAYFNYWAWYDTEQSWDHLDLAITGDGGSSWYVLNSLTGSHRYWSQYSLRVPTQYLTSNFRVGYNFISDGSIFKEGAYVDDIDLTWYDISFDYYSLSTTTLNPGGTFTVGYYITNPSSYTVNVGLGASLRDQYNNEIYDQTNDVLTSLYPGSRWYYRSFRVPSWVSPEQYDLAMAIWSDWPGTGRQWGTTGWMDNKITVQLPPHLNVWPKTLSFSASGSQSFSIQNDGGSVLSWSASESCAWITSVSPSIGSLSSGQTQSVTVTVSTSGLSPGLHSYSIPVSSNGGGDWVTVYLNVPYPPDLAWGAITPDPDPPIGGQNVRIWFSLSNIGQGDAVGQFKQYFYVDSNRWEAPTYGLAANTGVLCYVDTNQPPGYHTVRAEADVLNQIPESNENNNGISRNIWWKGPDLTVISIWTDPDGLIENQPFSIRYTIKNNGDADVVGTFRTWVKIDGSYYAEQDKNGLAQGNSFTWTFTHSGLPRGPHSIEVIVDVNNSIQEANKATGSGTGTGETNNAIAVSKDVQPGPEPSFTLSADPMAFSIQAGSSGQTTVNVDSVNGFNSLVSLGTSDLPSGITFSYNHPSVTPPPNGRASSALIVSVSSAVTAATYHAKVTATSSTPSIYREFQIELTVTSAPPLAYVILLDSRTMDGLSSIGAINFDGVSHSLPLSIEQEMDTYEATASPPGSYMFHHWESLGGVEVLDVYSQTTQVSITGNGHLSAVFYLDIRLFFSAGEYYFPMKGLDFDRDGIIENNAQIVSSNHQLDQLRDLDGDNGRVNGIAFDAPSYIYSQNIGGHRVIQYWIYYAKDDKSLSPHEHDFESLFLLMDASYSITRVSIGQHLWINNYDTSLLIIGSPVKTLTIAVERGGHGMLLFTSSGWLKPDNSASVPSTVLLPFDWQYDSDKIAVVCPWRIYDGTNPTDDGFGNSNLLRIGTNYAILTPTTVTKFLSAYVSVIGWCKQSGYSLIDSAKAANALLSYNSFIEYFSEMGRSEREPVLLMSNQPFQFALFNLPIFSYYIEAPWLRGEFVNPIERFEAPGFSELWTKLGAKVIAAAISLAVTNFVVGAVAGGISFVTDILLDPVNGTIVDTDGSVAGYKDGHWVNEIPGVFVIWRDAEFESYLILGNSTSLKYIVQTTEESTFYTLSFGSVFTDNSMAIFNATSIPLGVNEIHEYEISWDLLKQGLDGTTVALDRDGDGLPEQVLRTGENLTEEVVYAGVAWIEKTQYTLGEIVKVGFQNIGSIDIALPNTAPWGIFDSSMNPVYLADNEPAQMTIHPGERIQWQWEQKDSDDQQVPPGIYYFQIETSTGTYIASFSILDITPPIIDIISPQNTTYSNDTIGLIFTLSESTSWIGYSLDGQANVTIVGNIPLTSLLEGSHNIMLYANDTSGNMGFSDKIYFTIDTIPPTTSISLSGTLGLDDWYVSDITVTLTPNDDISVAATAYSYDGITWFTYAGPFVISAQGITTIYYNSTDNADNTEETRIRDVKIDKANPMTTVDLSGTIGNEGWYLSDVTVTLDATDDVSDIVTIEYSFDGINWAVYTSPFAIDVEGTTTVHVRSTDSAGNVEAGTFDANIDYTPPDLLQLVSGTLGSNDWYISDVTVTLSGDDAISGLASIQYSFEGTLWYAYSIPFTIRDEGITTLYHRAFDIAGNKFTLPSQQIKIDHTPPYKAVVLTGTLGNGDWYVTEVIVTITPNDDVSGVYSSEYSFDGINWTPYTAPFTIDTDGATILAIKITDYAGNEEINIVNIKIDQTPPDLEKLLSGVLGDNDWYVSDVTATLIANDATSGLASVQYSFDSSIWLTYSSTFTISDEGTTILYHKASDVAGNEFVLPPQEIKIDKTPPTISGAPTTTANAYGWFKTDVTVHFTADDPVSGIAFVTPDQTLSAEGAGQLVTGLATDIAGNTAHYTVTDIDVDKTAPSITGAPTTPSNTYVWYNYDVVVHFTASDSLSGILTVTPDQTISTEGFGQTVTGSAIDLAGNEATFTVTAINIDKTPPAIIGGPTTPPNIHGWYNTDVAIHFDASDSLSGIEAVTPDQTMASEGADQSVIGTATDLAGNSAYCPVTDINIDKTPPTITGAPNEPANIWGWYKTDVTIHFTALDTLSGINFLTPDQILTADGAGLSATGYATDMAGNTASYMVSDINIDKTPPTITGAPTSPANAYDWYNTDVVVHFVATDSLSGIDTLTPDQTLSAEAADQTTTGTAIDKAGNVATLTVTGINIDKTPPSITGAPTIPANTYGWYQTDVVIHFEAGDLLSGLDTVTPDQTLTSEAARQFVTGTAVDRAGNSATFTVTDINIDKTPPTVSGAPTTLPNAYGWYKTDVTLQFTAFDTMSGVPPVQIPPMYVLTAEGADQSVTVTVTDRAGNSVTCTVSGINIDKTPPSVSGAPTTAANAHGWYKTDVTIHFEAHDSLSGIDTLTPDIILTGEAAGQTATGTAVDKAGNEASYPVTGINIDKTPPTISGTPTTSPNAYGWYKSSVVVHFTASDSLSRIDFLTADQTLSNDGAAQSVTGTAVDLAGNEATYTVGGINIDKTPPSITGAPTTPANVYGWYKTDVTVHFAASDSLSGIDTVTPDQTLTGEGAGQSVIGIAVDKAENSASYTVTPINIDKTKPTTTLTVGEPWFGADPTYVSATTEFTLEASDSLSNLHHTEYKIDSDSWIVYTTPFNVPSLGSHTIYYRSIDLADNMESTHSMWIIVNAVSLTYTGDVSEQYSDPVTLSALLIDMATQQPISSKSITFALGSQSATSTTDEAGSASTSMIINQPAGTYTVSATFTGDSEYMGSSDSEPFIIEKEDATVEYTGETIVPTTAKTINLRATIFDSADNWWGDLTKIQVTFRIYTTALNLNSPVVVIGPIPVTQTNTPGVGVATASIGILPENGYLIIISLNTNDYYTGPTSDPTALTVYAPTGSFVTGGGWIQDPSGSKGNFGFNVKYTKSGNPQGHAVYVYREGGWDYIVKSNAWTGLAIQGNWAYFEAKCVIQKYNPATRELVWAEGNYMFRIDIWDNDANGGVDVYQIRVLDKNGVEYHKAAQELQGGNIVIHDERKTKP